MIVQTKKKIKNGKGKGKVVKLCQKFENVDKNKNSGWQSRLVSW